MKLMTVTATLLALASPVLAEGDVAKGEKAFGKCKSCHTIATPEGEVLFKGGRTGPNLFGVIGRTAGDTEFRYSKALMAANEAGLVWDEENLAAYVADPRGFMKAQGTDGKTKMTFKLKKGGADVAAFLASLAPAPEAEAEADMAETEGETPATEETDAATE